MLGAFRRYGVTHALRASTRTLSARSTPQRFQWASSVSTSSSSSSSYVAKSLYHPSAARFFSSTEAAVQNDTLEQGQEQKNEPLVKFQDLAAKGLVDPAVINSITQKMRIETMTDVQSLTIPASLTGVDVLAQAKTGTGKTLAFLVPVIQRILSDPTVEKSAYNHHFQKGNRRFRGQYNNGISAADIRAIIISPTRELAEQIAAEARRVCANTGLVVQTAVGGTQRRSGLQQIQNEGCHILVGTPGRLKDLLSDQYNGIEAPKLSCLVLDEADRLLDDGFAPDLMEIQDLLPKRTQVDRQVLMFSATLPREVMGMVRSTMKPNFQFLKTVRDDETPTHLSVPQKAVFLRGYEHAFPALLELVKNLIQNAPADRPFKAIVYINANKLTNLIYEAFDRLLSDPENPLSAHPFPNVYLGEIHSRLTQKQRTQVTQWFRRCKSGILFSSDVTARGMDFPAVTHVIQLGTPQDREKYIHRLGRTARANQTGEGWIILHEAETRTFRQFTHKIPIEKDDTSLTVPSMDLAAPDSELPKEALTHIKQMQAAMKGIPSNTRAEAWQSHMSTLVRAIPHKGEIVRIMTDAATHGYYLNKIPALSNHMGQALSSFSNNRSSRSNRRTSSYKSNDRAYRPREQRGRRFGGQDSRRRNDYEEY
ncbi:hypothetical protein P175DRAFT_0474534 [Aspergillus ochraceoroseus IBT 24754]|uniref:ATP-dependent RNA helicase n=3 Tax=Aspergillus subgen. Nidulantes TaxID=2720870 RepID=A0A0F8X9U0_9EURO|nr:uncharacterized protein P175DRAFT_0474534 [Aspergillus ochraceoroseus IBT 24754]KKK12509.1 hypothetical protein AOCH_004688 [Aspergillus ochraceoroseus]KKK20372.1 hypothetical protein ARAM_003111 [Aspergillus rambellii]PTU22903.1 hypothetical protein P175DRAFT_0474534 [Aspergillus ochraceoroseus IBT 24754]